MSYHTLNNNIKLQMKCTIFPINMGAVLSRGGVEEGGGCWLDSRDPWIRQALTFLSTPYTLYISMYILHTNLQKFPLVLTRRI